MSTDSKMIIEHITSYLKAHLDEVPYGEIGVTLVMHDSKISRTEFAQVVKTKPHPQGGDNLDNN